MNPELTPCFDKCEAAFDKWEASFEALRRYLLDTASGVSEPATASSDTAGCVTEPVQASSGMSELVTASAGLAEPPAPAPSIVASPVAAPAAHIDTIAVAPMTCSTECPSCDDAEPAHAYTPAAAPTSPTAIVHVIPMLAAAAAGDGTLDSEPIDVIDMQPRFGKALDIDVIDIVDISQLDYTVSHETADVEVLTMVDIISYDPGEDRRPPWPPPELDSSAKATQLQYADEACKLSVVQRQLKELWSDHDLEQSNIFYQFASPLFSKLEQLRTGKKQTSLSQSRRMAVTDMQLLVDLAEIEKHEMESRFSSAPHQCGTYASDTHSKMVLSEIVGANGWCDSSTPRPMPWPSWLKTASAPATAPTTPTTIVDITKQYVFVSHEANKNGVLSMVTTNCDDTREDQRPPGPPPPPVLVYVMSELQRDKVHWPPWPPPLPLYFQSIIVIVAARSHNSGVTCFLGTIDEEEQFTYFCANLNMLTKILKKPCAEWEEAIWSGLISRATRTLKPGCIPWFSIAVPLRCDWFSVQSGVLLSWASLLLVVFLVVLARQPLAQHIYILDLEELGETNLTIFVFMEDLLRRAMGNYVEFFQSNLGQWLSLVFHILKRMEALQQRLSDVHHSEFLPSMAETSRGTFVLFIQDDNRQVLWSLTETAHGLPLEVLHYGECPDLKLPLASYGMLWQIAWSFISGHSSSDTMKMDGNEGLLIRFHRVPLLVLLGSAFHLFSEGTCDAHRVQSSRMFASSNHLQKATYSKVEHLNFPVATHKIPEASHCGGEDNGLARASHIWFVAWTLDGLEFSTGCGQPPFQGGREVIRAIFSDQVHVSCDYYLDHTCYFDTGADYHDDSSRTREVHIPWDPGKLVLCYHPKLRLGDKPSFKEGGMLGPSPSACQTGPVPWACNKGLGPTHSHLQVDSYK